MKYFIALLLTFYTLFAAAYTPKDGDIIFHSSQSAQSKAIEQATHSPYSHMGIIFLQNGQPYVLEAASTVKYTPLQTWINRGVNQTYVVKRLNNTTLTDSQLAQLRQTASQFINKPYDSLFGWDDDAIYCSELVWKIYDRALGIQIGQRQKLKEFDLSSKVVQTKLKQRYGNKIPYNENVISPAAIFNSPQLTRVE
ncbi:YiiX family permuted papain-like enzyme [Orbus sasakiae]|uniref:YiiX family permuted papain-like enzyme n=1 Tax=Orbus sasakiae TaxID=1078475 RepID=A0ABP9N9U2_9GAMM